MGDASPKVAIDKKMQKILLLFQKTEITEYYIYDKLSRRMSGQNARVLESIAKDERKHYHQWKRYTGVEVKPSKLKIFFYLMVSRIFGITFAIKMLEKGEEKAEKHYSEIIDQIPEAAAILEEEQNHEAQLIEMIDEERIEYIGSMVLGLNDALVELTGALAGLTLALQNVRLIGIAGLITGIAASLSMAASEYLSQKSEKESKDPLRASFYTGIAYIFAVLALVVPYFILENYYLALLFTLVIAVAIIFIFSFFVAVVKEITFAKFFWEMVVISMGVAGISFLIGLLVRTFLHIDV